MRKNRILITAIVTALFGVCLCGSVSANGFNYNVGVHYYPWYYNDFHGGHYLREHLVPPQLPELGEYNDRDESVINQHIEWCRNAGVDFWSASWWGPGTRTDVTLLNHILTNPNLGDLKIAILYETVGRTDNFQDYSNIGPDITYLANNYFGHPNYLKIDGKPVIYVYLTRVLSSLGTLESSLLAMREAAMEAGYQLYIVGDHVFGSPPPSPGDIGLLDAIFNYDVYGSMGATGYAGQAAVDEYYTAQAGWKALAESVGTDYAPAVSPGYNDTAVRPGRDPLSRKLTNDDEFGSLFRAMLQGAKTVTDPSIGYMILVTSWNEWHEDTQIEPVKEAPPTSIDDSPTGTDYTNGLAYEGYDTRYLDILREETFSVHAYDTENVFVVVIDGLRNEEAFDDPDHRFIPHIWSDLRPEGTIYREFYNDFQTTWTTPGHEAMVTGQWHFHPNLLYKDRFVDVRPEAPTIFEYFREHTGLPVESCVVVTGKKNNVQLNCSLEPAYGPPYAALMFHGGTDDETYSLLAEKLAEHKPKLVLVNFGDVDEMGHTGDWEAYTNAIKNADLLVYRIWTELIQGDGNYMDKTTMIVTSDHGRNDEDVGFKGHGGMSHSNRHVLFLALGPDTPQGESIPERRYLIDIAPTAGELLGFPTPFSHGQVITGMIHSDLNPDRRIRVYRKNPRIATFEGAVFVAWSQNDSEDMGNERIYLTQKNPGEQSFGDPVLINDPPVARWAFYPSVAANIVGLHVVWLDGRALDGINDTWSIFYRKSPDWGVTWEPETLIVTSTFESQDPGTLEIVGEPEIISNWRGELIVTVRYRGSSKNITSFFRSTDQGKTWKELEVDEGDAWPRQYSPVVLSKPYKRPVQLGMTWIEMAPTPGKANSCNWEIFFKRADGGSGWKHLERMTYDAGYSDGPKLAWSEDNLIAVWADRDVSGAPWELHVRSSKNNGNTWGETETITTGSSAWKPSVVWDAAREEFFLVWTDYEFGILDLRISTSADGLNWTPPGVLSPNPNNAFRHNPQVGYTDGEVYIVWEELDPSTDDWVIETATFY